MGVELFGDAILGRVANVFEGDRDGFSFLDVPVGRNTATPCKNDLSLISKDIISMFTEVKIVN